MVKRFLKDKMRDFINKCLIETDLIRTVKEVEENQHRVERRIEDITKKVEHGNYLMQSFMANWQLETMGHYEDISRFPKAEQVIGLRSLMRVKYPSAKAGKMIRAGNANDGGYVMLDNFGLSKVAYSFGIFDDVTWDKYMVEHGFDVYMYDHTIEGLPEENDKFHWKKIGLSGIYKEEYPELRTLPMLLEDNGHSGQKHMILKMDIEGAEWSCFSNLQEKYLEQFDQLLLELHDMNNPYKYELITRVLDKLNQSHQLVHVHGNNNDVYTMVNGLVMPNVIEVTYLKRDLCDFEEMDSCFPDELDRANNESWPDIFLGKWK